MSRGKGAKDTRQCANRTKAGGHAAKAGKKKPMRSTPFGKVSTANTLGNAKAGKSSRCKMSNYVTKSAAPYLKNRRSGMMTKKDRLRAESRKAFIKRREEKEIAEENAGKAACGTGQEGGSDVVEEKQIDGTEEQEEHSDSQGEQPGDSEGEEAEDSADSC